MGTSSKARHGIGQFLAREFGMMADLADPSSAMPSGGAATAGPLCLETSLLGPLLVPHGAGRAAELEELSARATQYATRARGDGTHRAYRSAWQGFAA